MRLVEHDMAQHVVAWLESGGYTVYAEVPSPVGCSSVDMVGRRDGFVVAVEMKSAFTRKVLSQARLNTVWANESWVVAPTRPRQASVSVATSWGLGMAVPCNDSQSLLEIAPAPRRHPTWRLIQNANATLDRLRPGYRIGDAGKPCMKGDGPAIQCLKRVDEYRQANPGCTWHDIFRDVPNHYATAKSMSGALQRLSSCHPQSE